MLEITEKWKCSGCTACMAKCPAECIHMEEDTEGFLYPVVNKDNCIECNLCEKICPILNRKEEVIVPQQVYIVQNKDEEILKESTSGGAFTEIAKYVLDKGGVVYGASVDENFVVKHISVETKEELWKFRNSKYVQSIIGELFKEVEKNLKEDRWVCFSGTPCQVEGLVAYLGKNYNQLLTVDVVCRAVPSPFILKKYLQFQTVYYNCGLSNIMFRDKHYGYKYATLTLKDAHNNKLYHRGVESDPWLRAFFSNLIDRPSCYQCSFKKRYRVSDFTLWDCFSIYDYDKRLDNDKGVTTMLLQSEKARNIFEEIRSNFYNSKIEDVDRIVTNAKEMHNSVKENKIRKKFFEDALVMEGRELFLKYFPDNIQIKVKRGIRIACYKFGIYAEMKRLARRILGKR